MSILLTGANGYLGSRVACALAAQGLAWFTVQGRLQDLSPASVQADCVLHCAGRLRNQPTRVWSDNLEASAALARALVSPAHVVFVSTRAVYAWRAERSGRAEAWGAQSWVDEAAAPEPWDAYGASKWAAEQVWLRSEHRSTLCRVPTLFGHPERAGCFLDRALRSIARGNPLEVAIPDRLEDALDVDALASALVMLASDPQLHADQSGPPQRTLWNIAPPARSLHAMMRAFAQEAGVSEAIFGWRRLPIPATPLLNSDAFRRAYAGWRPPDDAAVCQRVLDAMGAQKPVRE